MMKTLIATTLLATSAHGALCTFENLPAPSALALIGVAGVLGIRRRR